jgi:hypothetical protein
MSQADAAAEAPIGQVNVWKMKAARQRARESSEGQCERKEQNKPKIVIEAQASFLENSHLYLG